MIWLLELLELSNEGKTFIKTQPGRMLYHGRTVVAVTATRSTEHLVGHQLLGEWSKKRQGQMCLWAEGGPQLELLGICISMKVRWDNLCHVATSPTCAWYMCVRDTVPLTHGISWGFGKFCCCCYVVYVFVLNHISYMRAFSVICLSLLFLFAFLKKPVPNKPFQP